MDWPFPLMLNSKNLKFLLSFLVNQLCLFLTVQSQPGFKYENSLYFLSGFAFASCLQNEPQFQKFHYESQDLTCM